MAVIFVLGFFIDFIEISVVVVPIVAPILLTDPHANVTAVWLGVMIGINMQTSFLTPPFWFVLSRSCAAWRPLSSRRCRCTGA